MMAEKIKSRGDGRQLGEYCVNDPKNAEAEILDVRGFERGDLADALDLAEIEMLANTRGSNAFAWAAIAPEDGETLTREQLFEMVDYAERRLGLTGHDRVIVRHLPLDRRENEGEHYHVVWNRYDRETGKLWDDGHSGRKLREAVDDMEERFGMRLRADHPRRGQARATDAEARQDERAAKPKRERSPEITALWNTTDSGKAFRAALEAAGYTLAYGKSRAYCVVDANGEVHSLARQIDGAKAADVKARLADLDPSTIPDADTIKAAIKQARKERGDGDEPAAAPRQSRADRRAAREAERVADAAAIRATETAFDADDAPHVPSPSERTEAERAANAGLANVILERVTSRLSTFTRADLERETAKMTGHQGRETWIAQMGGLDGLTPEQRGSAERSYERWAEENPHAAEKYGLARYVAFTQGREAERQGETDPAKVKDREEKRALYRGVMAALDESGEIVTAREADPATKTRARFTTKGMLDTELAMEAAAATLAERGAHTVRAKTRDTVRKQTEKRQGFALSDEQRAALRHITGAEDLSLVVGYAGAGKSTMLAAARGAFEAQGFRVRGTAISGLAAKGLEDSAGISSGTLHSLLHRLDNQEAREARAAAQIARLEAKAATIRGKSDKAQAYRNDLARKVGELREDAAKGRLTDRDVLIVDEAAMIGSRMMGRLLAHAVQAGAKIVLVGDHEQVQAIEAGAAFRALMDRHGAAVMQDVRRQTEDWQREATKAFPQDRAREALNAYRDHGMTHEAAGRDDAKAALIAAWSRARGDHPDASSVILTHTNADVHDLNQLGRAAYRAEGRLGEDQEIAPKGGGTITVATGDRLLFRKNDGQMDVKNGSLATVRAIDGDKITVTLDTANGRAEQGRELTFDAAEYGDFSHGYAATVHKTQGATVDRAFVLATPGMDKHLAYVAMSRHRERADLFHAREDFKDHDGMTRRLARSGAKDSVLDYLTRAEQGEGFASGFRAAVAGLWDRITGLFGRGPDHPAEAAERAREDAARAARRPAERMAETVDRPPGPQDAARPRGPSLAEQMARRRTDSTDPVRNVEGTTDRTKEADRSEATRVRDRAAQIARLREAERKKRENDPDGPGGRGG